MNQTAVLTGLWLASLVSAAHGQKWSMELELRGQRWEGSVLRMSDEQVFFLERGGRLLEFRPSEPKNYRKTSTGFRSYSQSEMRGQLLREFGRDFEVSGTGHYLVVHPRGSKDQWAQHFENLYRSFVSYFSTRGIRTHEPKFPLVAVVLPNRSDFRGYARRTGAKINSQVMAYYSPSSNRVVLYDQTSDTNKDLGSRLNADALIHETTHQTAFNTGIHSRFGLQPHWVVEGLGTMFEAPGVYDSRRHPLLDDRINRGRLQDFKTRVAWRFDEKLLRTLIGSDSLAKDDPRAAYAASWALTFYLAQTQASKYSRYLAKIASRPDFAAYPESERLGDFTAIFGSNFKMLGVQVLRFVDQLK